LRKRERARENIKKNLVAKFKKKEGGNVKKPGRREARREKERELGPHTDREKRWKMRMIKIDVQKK
jgi:hypothetical protein